MLLDHLPPFWLLLLIAVPLLMIFGALIFILCLKLEAEPTLEPVGPEHELYASVSKYFQVVQDDLETAGYEVAGAFLAPKIVSGTQSVLLLLLNPHARELALAHAIFTVQGDTPRLHACYLELQTEFEDELSVNTFNQKEAYPFSRRPNFILSQLPRVIDPEELLRVHRFQVQEHGRGRKIWKWSGSPIDDLRRDLAASHHKLAAAGFLRHDASRQFYRLTLPGAFSALGKALWPFSIWEKTRVRREESRILSQLDQFGPAR